MTNAKALNTIFRCLEIGPGAAMRESEAEKGHYPLFPCTEAWFNAGEWYHDYCISRSGRRVRICAIIANNRGNGAFRRLVEGIIRAGLTPHVVVPLDEMRPILIRWNWRKQTINRFKDRGWGREEVWFPQKEFVQSVLRAK